MIESDGLALLLRCSASFEFVLWAKVVLCCRTKASTNFYSPTAGHGIEWLKRVACQCFDIWMTKPPETIKESAGDDDHV